MRLIIGFLFLLLPVCIYAQTLIEGQWKGTIHYEQIDVPFSFHIGKSEEGLAFSLINGNEKTIPSIVQLHNDTLIIPLGVFDARLVASFTSNSMQGIWTKGYKDYKVAFTANYDQPRFNTSSETNNAVANRWQIEFEQSAFNSYAGIGLFKQEGGNVTGTIMTETSDLRYFEGVLLNDSIVMTSFDGVHAFLFAGKKDGGQWNGRIHFDNNYSEAWTATAEKEAELPDPWEIVEVDLYKHRPFYDILAAADNKKIIESDYFDKVLVIQLFGTWCPNSLDQTRYLIDWYKSKPNSVEMLAVAFEPYSKDRSIERISEYKNRLNIPYDVFLGGSLSKGQAAVAFPFIDKISAFPTLVIIDKLGYVRFIHSYFNGPATEEYYEAFKRSYEEKITSLVEE